MIRDRTSLTSDSYFGQGPNFSSLNMKVNPLHLYTKFEKFLGKRTQIIIGLSPSFPETESHTSIDHLVSFNYHFSIQHNVAFQTKIFGQFRASDFSFLPENSRKLIISHSKHGRIGVSKHWNEGLLEISTFYSYFKDLPVIHINEFDISETANFNLFNGSPLIYRYNKLHFDITTEGDGFAKTIGIDLFCSSTINTGKWKLSPQYSLSLFDSKFKNKANEEWKNSKYNFGYISSASISASKIFGEAKSKQLTYSLGASIRGGVREFQKNVENKYWLGLFDVEGGYVSKLKPYLRIDARIIYSWGKRQDSFRHRLSLDIQNVLNQSNDAYTYYDYFLADFVVQKQLGMIPILSYRYEFL